MMKSFTIYTTTVTAEKIVEVGAPLKHADPVSPDLGKIPASFAYVNAHEDEDLLKDNPADKEALKKAQAIHDANVVARDAARILLPAGSTVKPGDYLVGDSVVDGAFFELITTAPEAPDND
jgi:hypothetical protein